MPVFHAIILGVIQGLSEAFPISSSAHLVIIPWFFKWHYQGLSFDVALHVGTAIAFVIYFFKDWLIIIFSAFAKEKSKQNNLFWYIVVATIPAAIAGLIFEKKAEAVFRSPLLIAYALVVFAIILWIADYFGKKQKSMDKIDLKSAVIIGVAQALALVPGVSRCGITMTAGLLKGFSREAAARFSFLLATPIIIAAGALKLHKLQCADLSVSFFMGVLFSAASGLAGIHFLLKLTRKYSLKVFVLYRIAVSIIIILVFLNRI